MAKGEDRKLTESEWGRLKETPRNPVRWRWADIEFYRRPSKGSAMKRSYRGERRNQMFGRHPKGVPKTAVQDRASAGTA
ncbi:hypothetical protein [Bosea vestrisii]|uniref:Transposase n=1 Tax=Bosea vestrisii TaxID=151416 RepID=A0ABW0H8D2_9HYPH